MRMEIFIRKMEAANTMLAERLSPRDKKADVEEAVEPDADAAEEPVADP